MSAVRRGIRRTGCALGAALLTSACASAADVTQRSAALAPAIDPAAHRHCPARELAFAAAELTFARLATERADAGAAQRHLSAAESWADLADAARAACDAATPAEPLVPGAVHPGAPP